jgi:hypothetical protein
MDALGQEAARDAAERDLAIVAVQPFGGVGASRAPISMPVPERYGAAIR